MPSILLVRHGQASYGAEDYDLLSHLGHAQVKVLNAELQRENVTLRRVAAGSMRRQKQTATPVALSAGLELRIDAAFDECDAAEILLAYSTSQARLDGDGGPPSISSEEFQQLLDPAFGLWVDAGSQSATAESWPAFVDRTMGALTTFAAALKSGETALIATSGGVIAALCVRLLDLPDSAFVAFNRVAVNAALTRVVVGRRGMSLVSYNEHGYLVTPRRSLITYR